MSTGPRIAMGGFATVCCVHDREKRVVNTDAMLVALLARFGEVFDPKQDRIHRCGCCANLFSSRSDEPHYCLVCSGGVVHELGGPLADPIGEVSE